MAALLAAGHQYVRTSNNKEAVLRSRTCFYFCLPSTTVAILMIAVVVLLLSTSADPRLLTAIAIARIVGHTVGRAVVQLLPPIVSRQP